MKNIIILVGILGLYFTKTADSQETDVGDQKVLIGREESCFHHLTNETLESLKVNGTARGEDVKCYRTCLIKRHGYLQDGKILVDKYEEVIDKILSKEKERMMNATRACIEIAEKGGTECDVGARFEACHHKEKIKYRRRQFFQGIKTN